MQPLEWSKLGLLYTAKNLHPKLLSHTANPLAIHLQDDIYRIFFCGRDYKNRSSVGFVDADIIKREILGSSNKPVFEFGDGVSFFSHGVSIGSSYTIGKTNYILFMGWQNSLHKHWRGDIGRIVLSEDFTLHLDDEKPFLKADEVGSLSLSYPWIMKESNIYHMWYGSTITWDAGNGEMLHVINHAVSDDGNKWVKTDFGLPYKLGVAQAFSRPTVWGNPISGYHMFFSYRGAGGMKYRIGYATSKDLRHWEMSLDKVGLDVSSSGWDSEMIEYPFVFEHKKRIYMLYNGNEYGKTGFGLAVLKNELTIE